jgi:type I restriction-modification system DNA methylase subunit
MWAVRDDVRGVAGDVPDDDESEPDALGSELLGALLLGKLFGQEKILATSSIARMNMLLHGVEDFEIVRGDTLRDPAFFQ